MIPVLLPSFQSENRLIGHSASNIEHCAWRMEPTRTHKEQHRRTLRLGHLSFNSHKCEKRKNGRVFRWHGRKIPFFANSLKLKSVCLWEREKRTRSELSFLSRTVRGKPSSVYWNPMFGSPLETLFRFVQLKGGDVWENVRTLFSQGEKQNDCQVGRTLSEVSTVVHKWLLLLLLFEPSLFRFVRLEERGALLSNKGVCLLYRTKLDELFNHWTIHSRLETNDSLQQQFDRVNFIRDSPIDFSQYIERIHLAKLGRNCHRKTAVKWLLSFHFEKENANDYLRTKMSCWKERFSSQYSTLYPFGKILVVRFFLKSSTHIIAVSQCVRRSQMFRIVEVLSMVVDYDALAEYVAGISYLQWSRFLRRLPNAPFSTDELAVVMSSMPFCCLSGRKEWCLNGYDCCLAQATITGFYSDSQTLDGISQHHTLAGLFELSS
jgi:hypothetical protein